MSLKTISSTVICFSDNFLWAWFFFYSIRVHCHVYYVTVFFCIFFLRCVLELCLDLLLSKIIDIFQRTIFIEKYVPKNIKCNILILLNFPVFDKLYLD